MRIRTYQVHCHQGRDLQASAEPVPACLPQCVPADASHCGPSTLPLCGSGLVVHEASAVCLVPGTWPAGCCPACNKHQLINDYKHKSHNWESCNATNACKSIYKRKSSVALSVIICVTYIWHHRNKVSVLQTAERTKYNLIQYTILWAVTRVFSPH